MADRRLVRALSNIAPVDVQDQIGAGRNNPRQSAYNFSSKNLTVSEVLIAMKNISEDDVTSRRGGVSTTDATKSERLIGKVEVMRRVSLGSTSLWKLMCEGKFPRSRELGRNKVAWLESDIDEFIRTRPVRRLKGDRDGAA